MAGALAFVLVEEVAKQLASTTVGWLASKFGEEWKLLESFEEDLESMRSTFTAIQAVLEDAESRCIMPDSSQLRDWLKKLKDAAEDVADFLGEIETEEAAEQREEHQNRCVKKVRSYLCLCNPVKQKSNHDMAHKMKKSNHDMAHKMKILRERIDEIAGERHAFHLLPGTAMSDRQKEFHQGRETISRIDESEIVGREEDKENIIKLVLDLDTDNAKNVSVIPVVGLGGLGKTTLAQLVFNDRKVTGEHFDLRVWVCVSDDFTLKAIGKKILSATKKSCGDLDTSEDIANCVAEKLEEKRFLLVLDDVWNEDPVKWDRVKVLFARGKRGSKILVTTRSNKVAEIMGTIAKPYTPKLLSDDYCWILFKSKAFKEGEDVRYPRLVKIGRETVHKCGGVPLAAIALGGMMRHKRKEAVAWLAVRDNDIWKLEDDEHILPSLRLSYIQMPSGLKHCFTYCSIFPKDHQIDKVNLINQWIALGFISTEVSGSQYFDDLLSMSFLQELSEDWTGRLVCKMHDLVHDLARRVAGDEVLNIVEDDQAIKIPGGCRYLSLVTGFSDSEIPVAVSRRLRALHLLQYSDVTRMISDEAKCLRVLDLQYCEGTIKLLDSFNGLKQLGYLGISAPEIKELPESFSGLHYLQTLNLSHCESLESLPDSIARLQSLQNLDLSHSELQRTPKFDVGLQNLQFLDFSRCRSLTTLHESIGCLTKLRTLSLRECSKLESLPDSLSDLRSLEYLNLRQTEVVALPEDIGSLGNLQTLCLSECNKLRQLPNSIGKLQNLRTLDLSHCAELETLPPSASDLLNLEELNISWCQKITELPREMQKMARLKHLWSDGVDSSIPQGTGKLKDLQTLQKFIIGKQGSGEYEYASIAELQYLNNLSGQLKIGRLENVEDPKEAMSANLEAKHKLGTLALSWDSHGRRDEEVLESLQPHQNLETLRIEGYMGSKYPSWMINGNLVEITLQSCHGLPQLGRLPYLKKLFLRFMDVRQMGNEFCGGNNWATPFPALERLSLVKMTNLEEWLTTVTVDDKKGSRRVSAYPRLAELWIYNCKILRPQPCLPTSLEDLTIGGGTAELMERLLGPSSSAPSSSRGKQVLIDGGNTESDEWKGPHPLANDNSCELTSPPDSTPRLPNLQRLHIGWCEDLAAVPEWLGDLGSLQSVTFFDCPSLTYVPSGLQRLGNLLGIYDCPALNRGDMHEAEEFLPSMLRGIVLSRHLQQIGCRRLVDML